jgi:hypothetical protein
LEESMTISSLPDSPLIVSDVIEASGTC